MRHFRDWLRGLARAGAKAKTRREELLTGALNYVMREYGQKGHAFWRETMKETIIVVHPSDPSIEIEAHAAWDGQIGGPDTPIRVFVAILHATPLDVFLPTRTFIVGPDDTVKAEGARGGLDP